MPRFLVPCLACAVFVACSNTVYDFYPEGDGAALPGSGGDCSGQSCGTTGGDTESPSTGGTNGSGGNPNETGIGQGGDPSGSTGGTLSSCDSALFPNAGSLVAIRFVDSGNCIAQGEEVQLMDQWGYATLTAPCTRSAGMSWVVIPFSSADTFRSEATNMNLDVRFASPTPGTPLVLFDPHSSYNQRFQRLNEDDAGFLLGARHTINVCLTEIDNLVQIWPCDAENPAQRIELVSCEDL